MLDYPVTLTPDVDTLLETFTDIPEAIRSVLMQTRRCYRP